MNNLVTSSTGSATAQDGASIAYTLHAAQPRSGSPARLRIALIHSLALDRSFWNGVVPLLTPHADVLTYDCRGHGQSAKVKMTYKAELFAGDLASLLDHVNWPNAVIAGCSMVITSFKSLASGNALASLPPCHAKTAKSNKTENRIAISLNIVPERARICGMDICPC